MAALSPTYASPGLRVGLMLNDHPGAWVDFHEAPGSELGIPTKVGGGGQFCVATINFPEGSGRRPVVGYKPVESKLRGGDASLDHLSDKWNILCTKALGRALKRAGYPDDMTDLKALVVWRQRDAEIRAIGAGTSQVAIAAAQPEKALEAAGKRDPEATSADDSNAPDSDVSDSSVVEADVTDADPSLLPPSDATLSELRKEINGLGSRSVELTAWAKSNGLRVTKPATEADARALVDQAVVLGAQPPVAESSAGETSGLAERVDTLIELAAGLTAEEAKLYAAFLKSLGVDGKSDPRGWDEETVFAVLGWLEVDQ